MYAMILGLSSYLLALSSSWGCFYVTVDYVLLKNNPVQLPNFGGMGIGLFSYEDKTSENDLTCTMYSDNQTESFDMAFKTARAFGILANIFMGLAMILLICLSCVTVKRSVILAICAMLVLGGTCQICTFFLFASDDVCQDCKFFFGAGLSILCSAVALINALVTYHIPETLDDDDLEEIFDDEDFSPKKKTKVESEKKTKVASEKNIQDGLVLAPSDEESSLWTDPGTAKVSEKKFSDGRRQIIKTIVNQDGSRTVEETTMRNWL
jgi:hypothetical protein